MMLANGDHASEPLRLPFTMSFTDPLITGTTIMIEGDILESASSFSVNFGAPVICCFYTLSDKDIAFSLTPHFDHRYVVRNSTKKKKWRTEQITGNTHFPLRRGGGFCIEIFVTGDEFLVALNGIHYCNFHPEISFSSINSLEISGDIRLHNVSIRSNKNLYPDPSICDKDDVSECISTVNCGASSSQNLLKVPLMCRLPKTLRSGDVIKIEGQIKLLPYRFLMNLRSSEVRWPQPNILLHINGRYSYSQKNNVKDVFVFNSWSNGQWGVETKSTNVSLPMPGNTFKIFITCLDDKFEITSDEALKVNFPYRMSLEDAKAIYVQGDVYIYSVSLENASSA